MEISLRSKAAIFFLALFACTPLVRSAGAFTADGETAAAFFHQESTRFESTNPPAPFPAWDSFRKRYGKDFRIHWSETRSAPALLYGGNIPVPVTGSFTGREYSSGVLRLLAAEEALFGIDPERLELARVLDAGRWRFLTFRQIVDGLPAFGTGVSVLLQGRSLTWLASSFVPCAGLASPPVLSPEAVETRTVKALEQATGRRMRSTRRPVLGAFPIEPGACTFRPAYRLFLLAPSNHRAWRVMVDATSGRIIESVDITRTGSIAGEFTGSILINDPLEDTVERPFRYLEVSCEPFDPAITDEHGAFEIIVSGGGPFTLISNMDGPWFDIADSSGTLPYFEVDAFPGDTVDAAWDDTNSELEERTLFYHLGVVYSYIKTLDPAFAAVDTQLAAVVQEPGGVCNALWNGEYMLFFPEGGGCFSFALMRDVIYHEYGHFMNDMIFSAWQWPLSSWDEGTADYIAATITDDPVLAENYQGAGTLIRDCDNDRRYPAPECGGEPHCVGEATAGALWHMRENLRATMGETAGTAYADSLFHFAKFTEPADETIYFSLIVSMDDDDTTLTNGTPHGSEIGSALARHGFGQRIRLESLTARDISVNPGYPLAPGDTVAVTALLSLEPGALGASSLECVLSSTDPRLEIFNDHSDFGALEPGGTAGNENNPFLFTVPGDWEGVSDVTLLLTVEADPNLLDTDLESEIRVGASSVLLVAADPGFAYEEYYTDAFGALGIVPNIFVPGEDEPVEYNKLLAFELVTWFTGDADSATIPAVDRAEITEFLDGGGKLFLTGQGVADDPENVSFLGEQLDVTLQISDTDDYILLGEETGGWDDVELWIIGQGGANNQYSPDAVAGGARTSPLLRYSGGADRRGAFLAVDESTGARTVFFGFGFEGVTGTGGSTSRDSLMVRVLEILEISSDVDGGRQAPRAPAGGSMDVYPNPCNPSALIRYRISGESRRSVRISIYDISGRLVRRLLDDQSVLPGLRTITWNGRNETGHAVGSGVYAVVLESGPEILARTRLVVLK